MSLSCWHRIVAGQMDGSLSVMGHNGLLHHIVPAHDRAISILRLYGDSLLVSGSYDCSIKVHRLSTPLHHQLVCVNSIFVHEGTISAMTIAEVSFMRMLYAPLSHMCSHL